MTKTQTIIKNVFVAIYLRLSRDDQNSSGESMSNPTSAEYGRRPYR